MSKTTNFEPCLKDYDVSFRDIFTLIDPTFNTSEIVPFHLAIPRNHRGIKQSQAAQGSIGQQQNAEDGQKPKMRFLSDRYLKKQNQDNQSLPQQATNISDKLSQPRSEKVPRTVSPRQPNQDGSDTAKKGFDFWILPMAQNHPLRFNFTVDGNPGEKMVFHLSFDQSEDSVLQATMKGTTRADNITIHLKGNEIGESNYIAGNSSFYIGIIDGNQKSEVSATIYNPSFASASQPRIFDFLIPALKKVQGTSRMKPILFESTSGLVTRLSQMSKEAIRLKTRIPPNKGNSYDMTFDGKFIAPSLSNFSLYHDSNVKKDICSLGMKAPNTYYLDVGYPLSPIQGFMAAVSAVIPE